MPKKRKINISIAAASGIGISVTIVISILLTMLLTTQVHNENIKEDIIPYFTHAIILLASFAGCLVAGKTSSDGYAIVTGITSLAYLLILAGTGLLIFDGGLQNFWTSLLCSVISMVIACAICIIGKGSNRKRKKTVW